MPSVLFGGAAAFDDFEGLVRGASMTLGGWESWCSESVSISASWAWTSTMGMWPAMWCYATGQDTDRLEAANSDVNPCADWRPA